MNTIFSFISPLVIVFVLYVCIGVQQIKEGELGVLVGFAVLVVSILPLMLHLLILNLEKSLAVKITIELIVGILLGSILFIFI